MLRTHVLQSLLCCALLAACYETLEESYDTLDDARAAGLFGRGWIPDVLPQGSGPISHVGDLDTNAHCSRSDFPADSADLVRERLLELSFTPSPSEPEPRGVGCPFSADDIPLGTALRGGLVAGNLRFAAVSHEGVLFIWTERRPATAP